MIGIFRGLMVTIATVFKKPVTVQYPDGDPIKIPGKKSTRRVHLPLSPRYMGFPALLWDDRVDEPACTGCLVCMRYCPTECITVTMKDNPLHAEGKSSRRKIVDNFEIRMERCILCAICVEVCNFEAIAMTDFHEEANLSRGGLVATKEDLFRMGRDYQKRAGIVVGSDSAEESEEPEE